MEFGNNKSLVVYHFTENFPQPVSGAQIVDRGRKFDGGEKNEGRIERKAGDGPHSSLVFPPLFPRIRFNSLPTI